MVLVAHLPANATPEEGAQLLLSADPDAFRVYATED
jgi:hypothetical protein